MVTIRLPGQLRSYAGGQEFIDVAAATVDAALRELVVAYPDLGVRFFDDQNRLHAHLAVFYRETEVAREDMASVSVSPGERLDVLIAVAGGSDDVRMSGYRERATVEMTLTSAACPLTGVIEDQTRAALDGLVTEFTINWVWLPPWGPDKITDDGRDMLRALGFNL